MSGSIQPASRLNFAGVLAGELNTISSKHLNFFDGRYINTGEAIPQLEKLAGKVKSLEQDMIRQFSGLSRNISGHELQIAKNKEAIKILTANYDTLKRDHDRIKRTVDGLEIVVNRIFRKHTDLERDLGTLSSAKQAMIADIRALKDFHRQPPVKAAKTETGEEAVRKATEIGK
jgi:ABC-type transporter Mla subunit MlaD